MTKQEATVIEMYTGVCMLTGDDRKYFYEYAEKLLGRPIMTHEYLEYAEKLKELSKPDFLKVCKSAKNNGWIPVKERLPDEEKPVLVQFERYDKYLDMMLKYMDVMSLHDRDEKIFTSINRIPTGEIIAWRPLPDQYQPEAAAQRPEWKDRMLHTFLGGHHD